MSLLSPPAPTGHPKAFQSWHWVFLAAILLAVVAISTFYFSNAQAQTADGTITGLTLTSETPGTLTVSWDTVSPVPTDFYNGSLSHTYNGPYEITLTDITGTERMINDFHGGTTVASDEVLSASATNKGSLAMRFQTGGHAAGYTLDRIRVRSHDIADWGAVPEITMHQDASSSPGAKLCDIAVPDHIMKEPIRWISSLIHTYLAPDCADDVLASSSHYWIMFSGLDHVDYTLAYATSGAEDTDHSGSGWTIESTARKLASETDWDEQHQSPAPSRVMGQAELTAVRRARPRESANEASGGTGAGGGGGGTTPRRRQHELAKHPDDSLPSFRIPIPIYCSRGNDSSEGIA